MKPLVCVVDGKVEAFGRARGKPKAVETMLADLAQQCGNRPVRVAVFHADVMEEAKDLKDKVTERFDCVELLVTEFTPVMGAHTGPGVLGLAFYAE